MQEVIFPFVGGLGLFLVGMMLLSDGLVAFGGGNLQRALMRFTGTPSKAFVSGALLTAVVQSSTATTVTLIGFVSAGLITFAQAIGVVIGASLGNTATGWIVASLGLKISLGFYTLPLIGIGAMLKLLGRGRWAALGMALAGFGMLFLGVDTLQDGMQKLSGIFSLADLPAGSYGTRFLIMLSGLALTAILQSSTAAIAMALTALHTGTISFDQAAALVVGSAIGTTLTGALVAIGGTIYAKRTALAYILFNLVAGLIAMILLPLFLGAIALLREYADLEQGAVSLAAFHTLFISVGVLLFLPWTVRFAGLVERLLPESKESMLQRLDDSLLGIPAISLEASQRALEQALERLLGTYGNILLMESVGSAVDTSTNLKQIRHELESAFDFVTRTQVPANDSALVAQRIAQLHAIDHLIRFCNRLSDLAHARLDFTKPSYSWALENSIDMLKAARAALAAKDIAPVLEQLEEEASALSHASRQMRYEILQDTDFGQDASGALHATDTFRRLERSGHHLWRICYYLAEARAGQKIPSAAKRAEQEDDKAHAAVDADAEFEHDQAFERAQASEPTQTP